MLSKKIAIIGTADTILPFKAIGADGFSANDSEMAENLLENLILKNYGIIYIEEAYALDFAEKITRLNFAHRNVAITVIAGSKGGSGAASEKIAGLVKRAIGIDIFADK